MSNFLYVKSKNSIKITQNNYYKKKKFQFENKKSKNI